MQPIKIKENIYWVGGIDWDLRNFHGYLTQQGSTYNAYLIVDDEITLIDTVKHYLYDEMIERISKVIDPAKIDNIIINHVEMDHSGGLTELMKLSENAKIITSPQGEKGLRKHYREDFNYKVVKTGEKISLGKRNLDFVLMPMVHWPDSMACYCPEERILFPNDAFGQHIATSQRFDDEYDFDIVMQEARKYYANIVLPYGKQVQKALKTLSNIDIELIAPSHGLMWRAHIKEIIEQYQKWSSNQTDEKALIIYDTMWESTTKIAYAIHRVFEKKGIYTKLINLKTTHISDIITDVLTTKYICVGSPTLNNNMLPTVSAFLTYLKGLSPKDRVGLAFGSYGWNTQGIDSVENVLDECGFDLLNKITVNYIPSEDQLKEIENNLEGELS